MMMAVILKSMRPTGIATTAKQLAEINIVMDKLHFFKGTRTDGVMNTVTPTRLKN